MAECADTTFGAVTLPVQFPEKLYRVPDVPHLVLSYPVGSFKGGGIRDGLLKDRPQSPKRLWWYITSMESFLVWQPLV